MNRSPRFLRSIPLLALCLFFPIGLVAEKEESMDELWGEAAVSAAERHPGLKWFTEDKYAMFIHWGLYSEMAGVWDGKTYYGIGEWIMHMADIPVEDYKAYARKFNPQKFDAMRLVRLAKAAGMKTIVITSKHHDGFAMFDSAASDFTITKATPYQKDPMKELAEACRAEGLRFGFYYSQNQDWTEPYGGSYKGERPEGYQPEDFEIYMKEKVFPQVTELLTNYGPISMIWFDTPGRMSKQYSAELVALVKKHQPDCLINSRIGGGYGDYVSLGDMHIPPVRPGLEVWETVDTTNDSWSYAWYDENWKSPKTICERLVRVIARGGSYMLNVGPKGDGSLPEMAVATLTASGEWARAHGEAIYGTQASPFDQGFSWGDITRKGDCLYLHIFEWPEQGILHLADPGARVTAASLLHDGSPVDLSQEDAMLELKLGAAYGRGLPLIPVVKLQLDGPPLVENQASQVDGLTPVTLLAKMADVSGCGVKSHGWMEKFGEWKHDSFVENWKSPQAKASWALNVLEPGDYLVSLEYSCEEEAVNSEWVLSCGDSRITFITYESGFDSDKKFQPGPPRQRNHTLQLGVLRIRESGLQNLEIRPRNLIGEGIGIKAVTLRPFR